MVTLKVNGRTVNVEAEADMPLLWVLRDILRLTGTKFGCGIASCGACTVLVNGEAERSCTLALGDVEGEVTTIEGLAGDGRLQALRKAWIDEQVPQCGYCQSGQIMNAAGLLARVPRPADEDIDEAMAGNLCRCGTYSGIRRAIHRAASALAQE